MTAVIRQPRRHNSRLSIVWALFMRDMDYNFRKSPIGAIIYTLEPVLFILTSAGLHRFMFNAQAPYGNSLLLFYGAGHFPYYFFLRCSSFGRMYFYTEYPFVREIDVLFARYLVEGFRIIIVMMFFMLVLYCIGIEEVIPVRPGICVASIVAVGFLSLGIGMINSMIVSYTAVWGFVYAALGRGVMLLSAVLFCADQLPVYPRTIVMWNPLAQDIEWFRTGLYGTYPASQLDVGYLTIASCISVIVGIIMFNNRNLSGSGFH